MDLEATRKKLDLKPKQFAEALGVSPGHGADLRSGRRRLTLKQAAKLEELGIPGAIESVVRDHVA